MAGGYLKSQVSGLGWLKNGRSWDCRPQAPACGPSSMVVSGLLVSPGSKMSIPRKRAGAAWPFMIQPLKTLGQRETSHMLYPLQPSSHQDSRMWSHRIHLLWEERQKGAASSTGGFPEEVPLEPDSEGRMEVPHMDRMGMAPRQRDQHVQRPRGTRVGCITQNDSHGISWDLSTDVPPASSQAAISAGPPYCQGPAVPRAQTPAPPLRVHTDQGSSVKSTPRRPGPPSSWAVVSTQGDTRQERIEQSPAGTHAHVLISSF